MVGLPVRGAGSGRGLLLACCLLALGLPTATGAQEDALAGPDPETLLERALENLNATRFERIRMTNYRGSRKGFEREMEVWRTREGGEYRVLGIFTRTEAIRGTSVLIIPPEEAGSDERVPSNQYFVYVPALRRVKRVGGAQRADSFFGTAMSQGDVEPHPAEHFRVLAAREDGASDEPVRVLTVAPRFETGYDTAKVWIAVRDFAVLRVEQYREGREEPLRVMETQRDWLAQAGPYVLPLRTRVLRGRSSTEFEFFDRSVDAEIPDSIFSTAHLLRRGD